MIDNRGVGHSDCPAGLYTVKGMARDAREVMRFVGWLEEGEEGKGEQGEGEKVDVVGVSLGGMIAMGECRAAGAEPVRTDFPRQAELAALIPHRISSLTLGVTSPGHGLLGNLPPWAGLRATLRLLAIRDKRQRMQEIIDMCFPRAWLGEPCEMVVEGVDVRGKSNEDVMFEVGRASCAKEMWAGLRRARQLFEWRIRNQPPQSMAANLAQSAAAMTHYISRKDLARLNDIVPKIVG